MHSPRQFWHSYVNLPRLLAAVSALATAISIGWLGDGSYQVYDHFINHAPKQPDYDALILACSAFVFFSTLTAYLFFSYSKVRQLESVDKNSISTQAMIFTASPILGGYMPKFVVENGLVTQFSMQLHDATISFTGDLKTDIELLKKNEWRTSLQQVLRGLNLQSEHFSQIQYIYFITNGDDTGDFGRNIKGATATIDGQVANINHEDSLIYLTQFYLFKSNPHVQICCRRAKDKNDIDSYYKLIDKLIDQIELERTDPKLFYKVKVEKQNIFVDITCAQVPGSVGATLATLHNKAAIQYTESTDFGDFITEPKCHLYNVGIKTID